MRLSNYLKTLFLLVATVASISATAQVNGLSYTLQPTINYNVFDDQSALGNGLMYGGRLGLGFGQNVELRALYMRSISSNTNFDDFDFDDFDFMNDELGERDIKLVRYGGEVKLNLSRGKLLPYLTLGAGIQEFDLDGGDLSNDLESETIYAAGGLGIKLSFLDRFTFNLEARNTSYNQNAIQNLVLADDRNRIDLDPKDFTSDRLYNWSLGAGLEFYLGGRRPGQLSAVDQAYSETFGNGFRNISLLVEPTLSHINWDDAMPYENTYLGGASLGLDFGPLVGARLFYYRSMEDDEINFDFDDLSMYGADFRFRFNSVTTGLSPFVTVGGGYIDVQEDYLDRNGEFGQAPSQGFASGGGGISLNITRNFRLTGTYRALLTTSSDVEDVNDTDQIRTSSQWSAGVNLAFGKKAERPDAVFTSTADARLRTQQNADQIRMQKALADQARENKEATNQLRADYEVRMDELRNQLTKAEMEQDSALVAELETELDEAEEVVAELEERSEDYDETIELAEANEKALEAQAATISNSSAPAAAPANTNVDSGRISLTPAELEGLIEEIFEGINDGMQMMPPPPGMSGSQPLMITPNGQFMAPQGMGADTARINQMERDVANLRTTIDELRNETAAAREDNQDEIRKEMNESTNSILKEIRDMRSDINEQMSNKSNMSDKERRQMDNEAAKKTKNAARDAEKAAIDAARAAEKAARKAEKNGDN